MTIEQILGTVSFCGLLGVWGLENFEPAQAGLVCLIGNVRLHPATTFKRRHSASRQCPATPSLPSIGGKTRPRLLAHLGAFREPIDTLRHRLWFYERCDRGCHVQQAPSSGRLGAAVGRSERVVGEH